MTLPHNIERRAFIGNNPWASYRGWDALGRAWFIGGRSGAWRASLAEAPFGVTFYAPTLDALGRKLTTIGHREAA